MKSQTRNIYPEWARIDCSKDMLELLTNNLNEFNITQVMFNRTNDLPECYQVKALVRFVNKKQYEYFNNILLGNADLLEIDELQEQRTINIRGLYNSEATLIGRIIDSVVITETNTSGLVNGHTFVRVLQHNFNELTELVKLVQSYRA